MTETAMSLSNFPSSRNRATSISSNGTTSTTGNLSFVPRYTPKPDPAYISAASAAEHVTRHHRHESYDLISPAASPTNDDGDAAVFSDSALSLLNAFLDSLLYNFLAKARGTSIHQLKPAIVEVLKAKLGREAIASADEELTGLVSEDDDEDEDDLDDGYGYKRALRRRSSTAPEWHLESAFKRMRLRVMVFIRLGDFDDEDEERFLEESGNEISSGASATGSVTQGTELGFQSSPAPVYLASVLEFLAEQTLSLAGEAAYSRAMSRARANARRGMASPTSNVGMEPNSAADLSECVIVEEADVEKIALNPAFTRLWRTWLKSYRSILSPPTPSRSASSAGLYPNGRRTSMTSPTPGATSNGIVAASVAAGVYHKKSTSGTIVEEDHDHDGDREEESFHEAAEHIDRDGEDGANGNDFPPEGEPSETDIAANIPLPIGERDVDEIEVPGLAPVIYDDEEEDEDEAVELDEPEWVEKPRSLSAVVLAPFIRLYDEPIEEEAVTDEKEPFEAKDEDEGTGEPVENEEVEEKEAKFLRPQLKRQRSSSVPVPTTLPWDWIPLSIRRALYRLKMAPVPTDAELLELASGVPLPEDLEDEEFGEKRVVLVPAEDVEKTVDEEAVAEPESEAKESDNTGEAQVSDSTKMLPPPVPSKTKKRSPSPGVLAASAALAAATGVAAGTTVVHLVKPTERASVLSTASSKDLSVQTKEVFEPEDDNSSRRSSSQIVRPQAPAESDKIDATGADAVAAAAVAMMGLGVKQERQKFQPPTTVLESKKSPTVAQPVDSPQVADFDLKAKVLKPESRQPKKTAAERPISMLDEAQPKAYKPQPKVDAAPESKSSKPAVATKPVGTRTGAVAAAAAAISAATAAAASNVPSKRLERKPAAESQPITNISPVSMAPKQDRDSPTSPVSVPAKSVPPPTSEPLAENQKIMSPSSQFKPRDGPPKPLTSAANPYAMLYDDIEPDAIGVAKTSNVPIHASKPPVPAEQRPWTPNRGVGSVTRSSAGSGTFTPSDAGIPKSSLSERAKNVPKPLRTVSGDNVMQGVQVPRTVVSKAPAVEGEDKKTSVDPDRLTGGQIVTFQGGWRGEKPKESPIIPRFFQNEPPTSAPSVTTPTSTTTPERPTTNGVSGGRHSPKGSQGSNKEKELDPEAKAKEEKFDALLRQQEPMKYTLTPEEIRDVGPYSAKTSLDKKTPPTINTAASNIKAAASSVMTGPKSPGLFRKKEASSPQTAQAPVEKQPPATAVTVTKVQPTTTQQKKLAKAVQDQRPLTIGEIRKAIAALSPEPVGEGRRRSGLTAREPRVQGGDVQDFVDWIRTTGPDAGAPPSNGNIGRVSNVAIARVSNGAVGRTNSIGHRPNVKMVARDPGARGDDISDLADFIRNGPDGVSGKDKPLPAGPVRSKSPGPAQGFDAIRKTRVRPKDPYAIDLSDDEDLGNIPARSVSPQVSSTPGVVAPVARRAGPGPTRTLSGNAVNTLNGNGSGTSRSVSPSPATPAAGQGVQRSASSLSNRNSHPALSGGLISSPGSNTTKKIKLEARPAGATRGFGGHGYYYSTNDMADFLRTSGPGDDFSSRATTANGHPNGAPNGFGGMPVPNNGMRGVNRNGFGEFQYTMWRD